CKVEKWSNLLPASKWNSKPSFSNNLMIQDRDQKHGALKLSVANRWFPQLEVVVQPTRSVQETAVSVTDLDVFSSMPDQFRGFRTVVFDCKTKARESPVNRALWLRGVIDRLDADHGICVLKKD